MSSAIYAKQRTELLRNAGLCYNCKGKMDRIGKRCQTCNKKHNRKYRHPKIGSTKRFFLGCEC